MFTKNPNSDKAIIKSPITLIAAIGFDLISVNNAILNDVFE